MEPMEAGVLAHARNSPDRTALRCDNEVVTYGELAARARRAAGRMVGAGVAPGGTVAVMVENSVEFFVALHAAGRIGAIAVPINVHFKADEVGWIVRDSEAAAVVVARDLVDTLADVTDVARIVVDDGWVADDFHDVDDVEDIPVADPGDGWPTIMAYTSGTTGRPKGVAIGADDFRRRAVGVAAAGQPWQLGADDVHLLVGPAYHSGPGFWAQMHLAFGGSVVIMRRWDAARALALIEAHGVTTTHMVPVNFSRILALSESERNHYDLSSLTIVVHAAAPCPVPLKRAFMDFVGAQRVWEYYGASEGGGTVISPQEWLEHPGSVGRPFPGNEFVILDDDANPLPPGEIGTVYVKPTASSFEYHNDPTKTAEAHRAGFFTVGDAGYLDTDGYLYLTDRRADMVISGGVNIYPREVEDCLFRHPGIVDCAVLGVPDDEWGEVLYAVIQRTDPDLDAPGVIDWVRERLADYKRPRIVDLVDELPRDPNGKVRKHKLREAYVAKSQTGSR